MSADFLSQDEVDALLRGMTGEADEPESAEEEASGGVRSYNLASQERMVRGRMPTMEMINERFSRYLRIGLFNYIRRNAQVSVGPIRVQKYAEFLRGLVVPTNLNLIIPKPLRGTGLLVFDPNLVFLVVENMFGGDGRFHTRVEGREFTPTEQRIIHGLVDVVFQEYEKAWAPVHKLKFEFVRSEINPQFANIATPSEVVIATTFTLEIGGAQTDMHICLPYSTLEPIRDLLYSSMQSDHLTHDTRWTTTLSRQLQTAEVTLIAKLATGQLTLREINQLKVGDVIPVDVPDMIPGEVDGVPVLEGRYGVINGRYALKLERFVAEDELRQTPPKTLEEVQDV